MKIFLKQFLLILTLTKGIVMAETSAPKNPPEGAQNGKDSSVKKAIMGTAIEKLRKTDFGALAPNIGEFLPDHSFVSAERSETTLEKERNGRAAIITFYRGSWCPYCNIQLHALQERLPEITAAGGVLIAISPELPSIQHSTKEKANLEFILLSDKDGEYAKKIKILFALDNDLKDVYLSSGLDLEEANGNSHWALPLAATFVVDTQGKITYRFLDVNYKKRAEPADLIEALERIKFRHDKS